jgi:thiol-disulfide isomerase/thioredoxin
VFKLNITLKQNSELLSKALERNVEKQFLAKQDHGYKVGDKFPFSKLDHSVENLLNRKETVIIFSSPYCGTCKELYPIVKEISKLNKDLQFIFLIHGEEEHVMHTIKENSLEFPIQRLTREKMQGFQTFIFPYSYFTSPDGTIISKGVVNTASDFGILFEEKKQVV